MRWINIFIFFMLSSTVLMCHTVYNVVEEKPIVIVILSYNNSQFCIKNISSALSQQYNNYRIIFIDDCSTDDTFAQVTTYVRNHDTCRRVVLIKNETQQRAMANHIKAASFCKPYEIIVHLDGDDWFAHDQVLQRVNQVYANPHVWLTYGSAVPSVPTRNYPGKFPCKIARWVLKGNYVRKRAWQNLHMRTFYAALFHAIDLQDLQYQGSYVPVACDPAFMLPMLEMASTHACYIDEILYVYNTENPLNNYKLSSLHVEILNFVKQKSPYKPLIQLQGIV